MFLRKEPTWFDAKRDALNTCLIVQRAAKARIPKTSVHRITTRGTKGGATISISSSIPFIKRQEGLLHRHCPKPIVSEMRNQGPRIAVSCPPWAAPIRGVEPAPVQCMDLEPLRDQPTPRYRCRGRTIASADNRAAAVEHGGRQASSGFRAVKDSAANHAA